MGRSGSTLTTMQGLGWNASRPDAWIVPSGHRLADFGFAPYLKPQQLREVARSASCATWKEAGAHYLGSGLRGPPILSHATRLLERLAKTESATQSHWVKRVATGVIWPADRRHASSITRDGGGEAALCDRCRSGAVEATRHRYWEGRANVEVPSRWLEGSTPLVPVALAHFDEAPCYWGRALIPNRMWKITRNRYDEDEPFATWGRPSERQRRRSFLHRRSRTARSSRQGPRRGRCRSIHQAQHQRHQQSGSRAATVLNRLSSTCARPPDGPSRGALCHHLRFAHRGR